MGDSAGSRKLLFMQTVTLVPAHPRKNGLSSQ